MELCKHKHFNIRAGHNYSMAGEQQRMQQLADAEARRWWSERETKAEKEMLLSLHKRMEAQRAQIHAFKLEQSKWEHELQLRISKYAHDRKLLSEHNIELQEAQTAMEERYTKLQRESDLQATQILELEGQLRQAHRNDQQLADLRAENERLAQRLMQWESFHEAEVAIAVKRQEDAQNELISALEQKVDEVLKENERLRRSSSRHSDRGGLDERTDDSTDIDEIAPTARFASQQDTENFAIEAIQTRVAELEKACKQKDQSILSLRSMLDRHEIISDDKMKIIQAKYDQVKAINIALQQKLLQTLTDVSAQINGDRIDTTLGTGKVQSK